MIDQEALGIINEEYGEGGSPERGSRSQQQRASRSRGAMGQPEDASHYQHRSHTAPGGSRQHRGHKQKSGTGREKRFLREVQDELEGQRAEWKDEVEKMIEGLHIQKVIEKEHKRNGGPNSSPASPGATNYVDTSTGNPIFKAFVDVSEYPASGLSVTVDKLDHKLIVTANKDSGPGTVTRTFTQKVQLPRYADDARVRTKLGRDGVLTVEVPLLFYFDPEKKKSKSFINQVRTRPDGTKALEILVNVGAEVSYHGDH